MTIERPTFTNTGGGALNLRSAAPREWVANVDGIVVELPWHWTRPVNLLRLCPSISSRSYMCTRNEGHTGRHLAAIDTSVRAVWE